MDLICLAIFGKFYQSQEAGQDSAQTGKAHAQKDTNWERISDLFIRVFDITVTHYNSNINKKKLWDCSWLEIQGDGRYVLIYSVSLINKKSFNFVTSFSDDTYHLIPDIRRTLSPFCRDRRCTRRWGTRRPRSTSTRLSRSETWLRRGRKSERDSEDSAFGEFVTMFLNESCCANRVFLSNVCCCCWCFRGPFKTI